MSGKERDALMLVINDHVFNQRGRCQCGEWVSHDPLLITEHVADAILAAGWTLPNADIDCAVMVGSAGWKPPGQEDQCDANSYRASSKKNPYGPGGFNRCTRPAGHTGNHQDSFGNVYTLEPFQVFGNRNPYEEDER